MNAYERLSLKQVDKVLGAFKPLRTQANSIPSWIQYVRKALGLSTYQFAVLLGMRQSSLVDMEAREKESRITLENLKKAAESLGCELVYAFVPKTSLEDFVRYHEAIKVEKIIEKTQLTMILEKQGLDPKSLQDQRELLLEDIRSKPIKSLWSHYES